MSARVTVSQSNGMTLKDLQEFVEESLAHKRRDARARADMFIRECALYEQQYGMSTEEFLEGFESGELGDDEYLFTWYAAAQGREGWMRRVDEFEQVNIEPA